ncbi:hypothetical protein KPL71_015554 [Citrus sinensis]|uniref:Uncharacterized protein n=1 Tax=Citrus sinensis TaxID=2711 RepID=A0ACB8KKE1_CITSI|nr:hypothetical protein KPL71_015554 [Citrus sinensis]
MAEASLSSSSARTTVTNAKFEVEKFDGINNFGMWQCEVLDVLCQNALSSAKKLWETLEEKYMKKSLENRLYMKKKLYRFTYTLGISMNDHVNSFNKILVDLLNLDEKFEDEDKALLLNSLPDEYDHLTTTLLNRKDSVIFDAVCSALYNSETRKKDRKDHKDAVAEALTARGRSQSCKPGKRSKSKGKPAKDECAFCREKGHWKKNCPKLQKGKATSDACVAENDEESDFSLVGMTLICHSDEWILDSSCTYHMCPNKGCFFSFKELDGGVVFMGNDNACKTMGIGTNQLKNHDGSIQVLRDVRYVPSLNKNLISLGVLESKGFTITLRDGLLKVVVGALTVMKGTRINNLYYFQGSTVIGSASTVSGKDAFETCWKWKKMVETQTGRKVKRFRSDNGGEYKNDSFLQICQDKGIVRHFTVRDTPQQNGVAEHMNRTILEKVQCMLSNTGLGKEFWAEAIDTILVGFCTEVITADKETIDLLRVLACGSIVKSFGEFVIAAVGSVRAKSREQEIEVGLVSTVSGKIYSISAGPALESEGP